MAGIAVQGSCSARINGWHIVRQDMPRSLPFCEVLRLRIVCSVNSLALLPTFAMKGIDESDEHMHVLRGGS